MKYNTVAALIRLDNCVELFVSLLVVKSFDRDRLDLHVFWYLDFML